MAAGRVRRSRWLLHFARRERRSCRLRGRERRRRSNRDDHGTPERRARGAQRGRRQRLRRIPLSPLSAFVTPVGAETPGTNGGGQNPNNGVESAKHSALPTPTITGLRESAKRWRPGHHPATISSRRRLPMGTVFSFSLNEAATITATFTRQVPGSRRGGRCVPRPKHAAGKRCTLTLDSAARSGSWATPDSTTSRSRGSSRPRLRFAPGTTASASTQRTPKARAHPPPQSRSRSLASHPPASRPAAATSGPACSCSVWGCSLVKTDTQPTDHAS